MNIESHKRNLKESLDVLEECIEKGLTERQRTIGFTTSAACVDMLELFLHHQGLIDTGLIIKHEWLKSKNQLHEKLPFDFQNKAEILRHIRAIEEKRNVLCYGKPQTIEMIREVLEHFNTVKKLLMEAGLNGI